MSEKIIPLRQGPDSYRNDNPSRHFPMSLDGGALRHWRWHVRQHFLIGNKDRIDKRVYRLPVNEKINRRAFLQARRLVDRTLP